MPLIRTAKFLAGRIERFFIYRVLSLNDTPHRIALGVAIGIFVTWTPTIGLQMMLTLALAWLLRANKFVGVPFVWISNPLTVFPIYGPNYLVGCWVLGRDPSEGWGTIFNGTGLSGSWLERTGQWFNSIMPVLLEVWLGSLIVAGVLGILTYFTIYRLVVLFRTRWHHKHPPKTETESPPGP